MKVIRLVEEDETGKETEFNNANDVDSSDEIVVDSLNSLAKGWGDKIKSFGIGFPTRFVKAFNWNEMNRDNLFIKTLNKIEEYNKNTADNLRGFQSLYNGYVHDLYDESNINDPNSVVFNREIWLLNNNKDIDYVITTDEELSNNYLIEKNADLIADNLNNAVVSNRLPKNFNVDKVIDSLETKNSEEFRNNIIYNNGRIREPNSIKKIMNGLLNRSDSSDEENNDFIRDFTKQSEDDQVEQLKLLISNLNSNVLNRSGITVR